MKRELRDCRNCSEGNSAATEHIVLGFVPRTLFEDDPFDVWVQATICDHCATLHFKEITEEQLKWAEERYVAALVDAGHMTEEGAEEILGIH